MAAGIDDPKLIENAEKLVDIALEKSIHTPLPFGVVLQSMLHTVQILREKSKPLVEGLHVGSPRRPRISANQQWLRNITPEQPKEAFGFPVSLQEWMPTHYAAMSSSTDLLITDLRTGEIRRVTKEDMEKALSEFFAKDNV